MKKLSLKCEDLHLCFTQVNQWMCNALERGVVDLELTLHRRSGLPPSVFANKTLVKLTLLQIGSADIFINVSLPVLKTLVVHTRWPLTEFLFNVLLPGCPILEELSFFYHFYIEISDNICIKISHKTLKRLTIHYIDYRYMTFDTPSLVYLEYSGLPPLGFTTPLFLDSLLEANLDLRMKSVVYEEPFTNSFSFLRNVKTLSLSCGFVDLRYSWGEKELPLFLNLVKLYYESNTNKVWEVLPSLLKASPKLETLVLRGLQCVTNDQGICIDQNEVKVLEIYGFTRSGGELRQVKSFLCQMQFLQVMKVKIDADDDKKLQLITSDLLALPRPSSKFRIQFL